MHKSLRVAKSLTMLACLGQHNYTMHSFSIDSPPPTHTHTHTHTHKRTYAHVQMQQWMYPLIRVTLEVGDDAEFMYLFFRMLKMALPNNLIWLILFYLYFHSWMNLWAELLRFGDRQFYRDWWNAHTVYYFWRNWNIPVHKWMQRHVYRPLRAVGATRLAAVTFVFALSAVLHEVLVDIPLGVFKGYAFAGMFIYVPLAVVTDLLYK
jgi:diacylglycerol O-acyltransferase-1